MKYPGKKKGRILFAAFTTLQIVVCVFAIQAQIHSPELIFQTGFEGSSRVVAIPGTNDYGALQEKLTGTDNRLEHKNNWDKDWLSYVNQGYMQVQYTGGDSTQRYARVVTEPGKPGNHVLKYWLNDSWLASEGQQKARIQTNLYGIKEGLKEFYQSVNVYLTEDFNALKTYPGKISWCTIAEFWNNEWWVKEEKHGFRITVGIGKESGVQDQLHFILEAENPGQKLVWRAQPTVSTIAVPIGKWFKLDYYFKEGDATTGRFYLAITPEGESKKVVYDVRNFTHMTKDPKPGGLTGYNPMKLYTSKDLIYHVKSQGKTLQVYWDDFELWKNKRP